MNRFYHFGLRIDQAYFFVLAFAFLASTILGCTSSGISPIQLKPQNADSAFDESAIVL